jgi:hypothetical protein
MNGRIRGPGGRLRLHMGKPFEPFALVRAVARAVRRAWTARAWLRDGHWIHVAAIGRTSAPGPGSLVTTSTIEVPDDASQVGGDDRHVPALRERGIWKRRRRRRGAARAHDRRREAGSRGTVRAAVPPPACPRCRVSRVAPASRRWEDRRRLTTCGRLWIALGSAVALASGARPRCDGMTSCSRPRCGGCLSGPTPHDEREFRELVKSDMPYRIQAP